MAGDPERYYLDGYAAFDRGEYRKAVDLATGCLSRVPVDSYWYAGALGLRCWAANFLGDDAAVVRDANALLALDTGDDKMWFDGLAVLNLAIIRRRLGDVGESELLFSQASAKYAAYHIPPDRPSHQRAVNDLFIAVSHWAACGETDKLDTLSHRLSAANEPDEEIIGVYRAVDLYRRLAGREDVRADALAAAGNGVSRAFLAVILI